MLRTNSFLEAIENIAVLRHQLYQDQAIDFTPEFLIDGLLRKKYSSGAIRVIQSLENIEIVSGDPIRNMSLEREERLYPDFILFNPEDRVFVLIENKIGATAEREAITELFGYAGELRNHLPYLSDHDLHYVVIATAFNTLLDHAITTKILASEASVLCLVPKIENAEVRTFTVHFPQSWTNIGQIGPPSDALTGYTMFLSEREDITMDNFSPKDVIQVGLDLITHSANLLRTSGFCFVWANGLKGASPTHAFSYAISFYQLNPYAFLRRSLASGMPMNQNSALLQYLTSSDLLAESDSYSLLGVSENAENFLSQYFIIEKGNYSSWHSDTANRTLSIQRYPLAWNSFGAIGSHVRELFIHPSFSRWFQSEAIYSNGGYMNPFIGFQLINKIAGIGEFSFAEFRPSEIFNFLQKLMSYRQACRNAMELDHNKRITYNAYLFWSALELVLDLKEVGWRVMESVDIEQHDPFPLALVKENIDPGYEKRLQDYILWFKTSFLKIDNHSLLDDLYELSLNGHGYFDELYRPSAPEPYVSTIENWIRSLSITLITTIATALKTDQLINPVLQKKLDQSYFDGKLGTLDIAQIKSLLSQKSTEQYCAKFLSDLLPLVDLHIGPLAHELAGEVDLSAIDVYSLYLSAKSLFSNGIRNYAVIVSLNGRVGLTRLENSLTVQHEEEIIYMQSSGNSAIAMISRHTWDELFAIFKQSKPM